MERSAQNDASNTHGKRGFHPLRKWRRLVNRLVHRFFESGPKHICTVCASQLQGFFEKKQGKCADPVDCLENYWANIRSAKATPHAPNRRRTDRSQIVHTPRPHREAAGRVLTFAIPMHSKKKDSRSSRPAVTSLPRTAQNS